MLLDDEVGGFIIVYRFNQKNIVIAKEGLSPSEKSTRIFSITHEQDVDGLFCGAILKNTFRNTLVFLTNHGYRNTKKTADLLERNVAQSKRPGTVVTSDLSLNSKDEAEAIGKSCLNAKQYGWEIV